MRAAMDEEWEGRIWKKILDTAAEVGADIQTPRRTARQVHRSNVPGGAADYYKFCFHFPILFNS